MWPDRVLNAGPLTYRSGAPPTALRGPAHTRVENAFCEYGGLPKPIDYMRLNRGNSLHTNSLSADIPLKPLIMIGSVLKHLYNQTLTTSFAVLS